MKTLDKGIYLIVFCLPLYLIRFSIFNIPTTLVELMIYALFVFWLIKILQTRHRKLLITNYQLPVTLIFLGATLAMIFSNDLRVSAGIWKAWFVDPLLFFIVFTSVIKNIKQIKGVFYSLFLSGTVVAIISIVYLLLGKFDPSGRLEAFFDSPNYLAMFLAPAFILAFEYYFFMGLRTGWTWFPIFDREKDDQSPERVSWASEENKKIILKSLVLITTILMLAIVIFFTKSYGAWLGIVVALSFWLVIYFWKLKEKKKVIKILIIGITLLLVIGSLKVFIAPQGDASINARMVIWRESFQIAKDNLFLGIGPGTFDSYFSTYPEWSVPQPHNLYLAFLLQTGAIGFIGFIWLLTWFFGFKPKESQIWAVLASLMIYILIHGLFDTTYWKNDLAILFWVIIGLRVVLRNKLI